MDPLLRGFIKRAKEIAGPHHHVYVVQLAQAAAERKKVQRMNPKRDPKKPVVYVGSTGLTPEERFTRHKNSVKQNNFVTNYGEKLLPDLYQDLNPTTFLDAEDKERLLASKLRQQGYTVIGGN